MSESPRVWSHPSFGEFTRGYTSWEGQIVLPAFAKFDLPLPKGRYELHVGLSSLEEGEPQSELLGVAEKIVESQTALGDAILMALWRELTGEGPDSGMGWHGAIANNTIPQFTGPDAPEGPEDIVDWIELWQVRCVPQLDDEKPVAEFAFRASWEEEHGGMGVLLEEGVVTGIGFGGDAISRFGYKPPELYIDPLNGELM